MILSWLNPLMQNHENLYRGLTVKLYLDFQLCGALVPKPLIFQGPNVVDPFIFTEKLQR